jgi:hypothetical protein
VGSRAAKQSVASEWGGPRGGTRILCFFGVVTVFTLDPHARGDLLLDVEALAEIERDEPSRSFPGELPRGGSPVAVASCSLRSAASWACLLPSILALLQATRAPARGAAQAVGGRGQVQFMASRPTRTSQAVAAQDVEGAEPAPCQGTTGHQERRVDLKLDVSPSPM